MVCAEGDAALLLPHARGDVEMKTAMVVDLDANPYTLNTQLRVLLV